MTPLRSLWKPLTGPREALGNLSEPPIEAPQKSDATDARRRNCSRPRHGSDAQQTPTYGFTEHAQASSVRLPRTRDIDALARWQGIPAASGILLCIECPPRLNRRRKATTTQEALRHHREFDGEPTPAGDRRNRAEPESASRNILAPRDGSLEKHQKMKNAKIYLCLCLFFSPDPGHRSPVLLIMMSIQSETNSILL